MYQLFSMNPESLFYDEDGNPIEGLDIAFKVQELWSKTHAICFAIQQRHSVEIERAYVGFSDDRRPEPHALFEVDFINILANENLRDRKLVEARIKKLQDRMTEYLSKIEEADHLLVAIKYKHPKKVIIDDNYNRMISHFMDLEFATSCLDEDSQKYVYQSYSCGDYDSGYYSSSEEFTDFYSGNEIKLVRMQTDQPAIKKIIKKFGG
jgi:hypothetical protein